MSLSRKHLILTSAVGIVLAVALRTVQLLLLTDSATGFVIKGNETANTLINIGYILVAALSILPCFFAPLPKFRTPIPNIFQDINLLIIAVCLLIRMLPFGGEIYSIMYLDIATIIELLFLLLACAFFVVYGLRYIANAPTVPMLTVCPVLLAAFDLVKLFLTTNGIANIEENIFLILFDCAMLLFFLMHGKVVCRLAINYRVLQILIIICCLLAAICSVPPFITFMAKGADALHGNYYYLLPLCFFYGSYTAVFYFKSTRETK